MALQIALQGKYKSMFQDISKLEFEWIGILLIFILYEFLNYAVAAPGCPRYKYDFYV